MKVWMDAANVRLTKNGKAAGLSFTKPVRVATGTRVGLIEANEGRIGPPSVYYKVWVQTGPSKGAVLYTITPGYADNEFERGESAIIVNVKRAYGAFDALVLANFVDALSVGDSTLCRAQRVLDRVIPLPQGTRLVIDDDPLREATSALILVSVVSGNGRGKTLYVEREYVRAFYGIASASIRIPSAASSAYGFPVADALPTTGSEGQTANSLPVSCR